MMQSFAMMAIVTVIWGIVGFSLAFGPGNSFIGNFQHLFLHGVGAAPDPDYAPTIPLQTFMVYQLMFAIITPALISGAFAERMKFSGMVVFLSLWSMVIYSPMAHMVWGKGGLLNASLGGRFPCLDFAGGTVVHVTSGVSALVCALYLGKRKDFPSEAFRPHSMVLSFIGACMLWVGWFGFNAGSALSAGSLATSAFVATHFAAAAAAIGWIAAEWISERLPQRAGCNLRRGRRTGGHHSGLGLCRSHVGAAHRPHRRRVLFHHGHQGQGHGSATTIPSMPSACTAPAEPWEPSLPAFLPAASSIPSSRTRRATPLPPA